MYIVELLTTDKGTNFCKTFLHTRPDKKHFDKVNVAFALKTIWMSQS